MVVDEDDGRDVRQQYCNIVNVSYVGFALMRFSASFIPWVWCVSFFGSSKPSKRGFVLVVTQRRTTTYLQDPRIRDHTRSTPAKFSNHLRCGRGRWNKYAFARWIKYPKWQSSQHGSHKTRLSSTLQYYVRNTYLGRGFHTIDDCALRVSPSFLYVL